MNVKSQVYSNFRTGAPPPRAQRYAVHWKIGVMYAKAGKREIFHGKTFEVSVSGASFLSQHNVFMEGEVTALLALPWYRDNINEKLIEIKGRVIHTVLSSETNSFRTGLQFISFKNDTGYLLEIALRDQPKLTR